MKLSKMDEFKRKGSRKKKRSEADEMGQEIQNVLSKRRLDRNWSMKVKRNPQTESLFHDTSRLIRNLNVIGSFEFKRVKCYTKNSTVIYLPADYDDPVLFTKIEKQRVNLKNVLKSKSTAWMTVMTKFYHEKSDFDVSEVLRVQKPWFGRRFATWLKRITSSNGTPTCLNTYIYPDKKCIRVPKEDLERHCQLCDSPSMRCYKSLSKAIQEETMPFILTIPFDPFTRSIQKATSRRNTKTSYFEKLVMDSVETLDVFLTYFNDDDNVTAVVIPEDVTFNVEQNGSRLSQHETPHEKVSNEELDSMYQKLEPLIMKLDDINDVTLIDIEVEDDVHKHDTSKNDFFEEFEMQCIVNYKAHIKRSDSTRYSTAEDEVPNKHSYYNVADEIIPEQESDEEEVEMATFDEGGHIRIHSSSSCGKNNNDYLSPLNEFTKGYSRFKKAMSAYAEHERQVSGDIVIGRDGYVQVSEKEELRRMKEAEQETKTKKMGFWKRKKKYELEEKENSQEKTQATEKETIDYYQPMYNIYKEKPPVPVKNVSTEQITPTTGSNSPEQPIIMRNKPAIPPRSILEDKNSSMKPLLQSFDEEDSTENRILSRTSFKRRSAPGLDSRINYFEAKNIKMNNSNK